MSLSREELEERVIETIAEALDLDPSEIGVHASLIDDLGAESIDFLDIRFRVETAFDMRIDDEELWQGLLLKKFPHWVTEKGISEEGMKGLRQAMPDFRWDRFPDGVKKDDLPRLITVRTVIEFLSERLELEAME